MGTEGTAPNLAYEVLLRGIGLLFQAIKCYKLTIIMRQQLVVNSNYTINCNCLDNYYKICYKLVGMYSRIRCLHYGSLVRLQSVEGKEQVE